MTESNTPCDLIVAPLAGFNPDGSVNLDVIPQYAAFLHANGVAGAFVNGTTGEGLSLTVAERKAVAERWIEASPAGFTVIVHVTCSSVADSKELAAHARDAGADAIGVMGPSFYKPSTVGALVDLVAAIASKAPELACYYYHMPAMNGVNFPMIEFLEAAHGVIPNLAGIKYTYEDLTDADFCRQFAEGQYNILHGRDETLLCGLTMGATGAVGSTYNFMAPLYLELIAAFEAGDIQQARKRQRQACDILRCIIGTGSFFGALKAIMRWIGIELNGVRTPLAGISSQAEEQLKHKLTELHLFEFCNKEP